MPIKPTPEEALLRLRLDDSLLDDVAGAVNQAHAQAVAFLDGKLYETPAEAEADGDLRGIECTPDIVAAQILLVDVLVGNNDDRARESKSKAAYNMLRPHRRMGA